MTPGDLAQVARPTLARRWIHAARGEDATTAGPVLLPGDLLMVLDAVTFPDWIMVHSATERERLLVHAADIYVDP
jgi:hypothetical protein